MYKIRLVTGTRDLTSTGNVLYFVTVASTERHKGVDSVGIIGLDTFRIRQMADDGIPDLMTSVFIVWETFCLHNVRRVAVLVNVNGSVFTIHCSTHLWNTLTSC